MGTHGGMTPIRRAPGVENFADSSEHALKVRCFLREQRADVDARSGARPAKGDDVLDLGEREPQSASVTDEGQQPQYISRITAISGWRSTRGRQNAARFVEPKRLAAESATTRDVADEQPVFHGASIRLAPWDKVNGFSKPRSGILAP
jgi:hypothetical protein